jgi:hypothetical protein
VVSFTTQEIHGKFWYGHLNLGNNAEILKRNLVRDWGDVTQGTGQQTQQRTDRFQGQLRKNKLGRSCSKLTQCLIVPDDGVFVRNVRARLPDYTASHPIFIASVIIAVAILPSKGMGAAGLQPLHIEFKKNTGFVDTVISKRFAWFAVQPKSATEISWWQYIRIWENKLVKLKKNDKIGHCDWVTEHVVIFVCI